MLKFIAKLILFFLPLLLLLFAFPLYVYWEAREFIPVSSVIKAQEGTRQILYGLAYSSTLRPYKSALVAARNPQILVLGTSRVLGFHESYFSPDYTFANAGNGIENIPELTTFIQNLPTSNRVKLLIIGLDPWMFKPGNENSTTPNVDTFPLRLQAFFTGEWRTVWTDYFAHKFSVSALREENQTSPYVGLTALVRQDGFLNDGSRLETSASKDPARVGALTQKIAQDSAQIAAGDIYAEYGTEVSPKALAALENLLELCQQKGIAVVGYIPPYPHEVYRAYINPANPYAATALALAPTLNKLFSTYHQTFFDYTDAQMAGIPDSEFIDDAHVSDKADVRILIDMAQKDPVLVRYVSLPTLRSLLKNTPGDFVLTKPE